MVMVCRSDNPFKKYVFHRRQPKKRLLHKKMTLQGMEIKNAGLHSVFVPKTKTLWIRPRTRPKFAFNPILPLWGVPPYPHLLLDRLQFAFNPIRACKRAPYRKIG